MDDATLIQTSNIRRAGLLECAENCNRPAIILRGGVHFTSPTPKSREEANEINQVVEDMTGVEIPTILR